MSEFRKDIVSGDWIVMAPERSRRPHDFKKKKKKLPVSLMRDCPFEHPELTGNWPPIYRWPEQGDWKIILIPNKFPALQHGSGCATRHKEGIYDQMDGTGWHNLLVTRNHQKSFPDLPPAVAAKVFAMFQERYREAGKDECLMYVSTFANWGAGAGASLAHPHYQMLALPIIPPNVLHALNGAEKYFKTHDRCVHCDIIIHERKHKKGMIAENEHAVAFAPFASREPYAVQIFPKKHQAYFELSSPDAIRGVTVLLQKILNRISKRLGDPDYNFFIHSAPVRHSKRYDQYHWHVEVAPKMTTGAGFELSTGVNINTTLSETAAKYLR